MLPDYLIYEQLERLKREREQSEHREQPRLEMPHHIPFLPSKDDVEEENNTHDDDVIIIKM